MFTLTKRMMESISTFVAARFVDYVNEANGQYERFRETAEQKLILLCQAAELVPDPKRERKMNPMRKKESVGARTTAHNGRARFYFLVTREGCDCPILCKPTYCGKKADRTFLNWIVVPDSACVMSVDELVSYHLTFNADLVGKSRGDILLRVVADSARQAAEDPTNNTRQRAVNALEEAVKKSAFLTALCDPYLSMSDEMFTLARPRILSLPIIEGIKPAELLAHIEVKRAELSSDAETESDTD